MAPTAVFDINETTLDLTPVRVAVETIFNRRGAFETWFTRLLQLSMATSATGEYADFSELARSALGSVAQTEGQPLPRDAAAILGSAMASLRAYPDVADGLDRLRSDQQRTRCGRVATRVRGDRRQLRPNSVGRGGADLQTSGRGLRRGDRRGGHRPRGHVDGRRARLRTCLSPTSTPPPT